MRLNDLLYRLSDFGPRYMPDKLTVRDVYGYELVVPGITYNENIVFIGWTSQLQTLLDASFPADAALLLIEDRPLTDPPYTNLVLLDQTWEIEHIIQGIVSVLSDDSRSLSNCQILLSAYNTNRGLQYMVDVASDMLGNPMIVADVSYKILAMSKEGFDDRPDIERQRALGYVLAENVSDLKKDHVHENARRKGRPYYSVKPGGEPWLNTLVYLNGVEVGHIDVMERNRPFTDGDYRFLHFMSGLVSLELQKNDFFKANRSFLHSFFLAELLEGQIPDANVVELRLQHLSWTPGAYLYVMVLSDTQPGSMEGKSSIISQQVHDLLPGSRWAMYNGTLVFLLNFSDKNAAFLEADGALSHYLEINHLTASVSSRFKDLLHTHRCYLQAVKARELGRRLTPDRQIYFYPDYLCHHIAGIVGKDNDLADFLHPAVPDIIRYDKEHKTNLLQTLNEHLCYGDNPTVVARNLFIHRNTLFYRIAKIKELFNLDLSSGEERMRLLLSMKFLQVMDNK